VVPGFGFKVHQDWIIILNRAILRWFRVSGSNNWIIILGKATLLNCSIVISKVEKILKPSISPRSLKPHRWPLSKREEKPSTYGIFRSWNNNLTI